MLEFGADLQIRNRRKFNIFEHCKSEEIKKFLKRKWSQVMLNDCMWLKTTRLSVSNVKIGTSITRER